MRLIAVTLLCTLAVASPAQSPSPAARSPSPSARDINAIAAFDDHAHPMLSPPDDATDRNFDALPVDSMAPQTDPAAYRPDNPQLADAWRALFHVDLSVPLDAAGKAKLAAARAAVKAREGAHYSAWVLDQANIATMVANRVAMGNGVQPPRFLWVPYDDALIFPLDNTAAADTPDRAQFFPLEDKLRARYLADAHLDALPPTLDDYLDRLVYPTLRSQHAGGAIAIKFELAYLRSLNINNPSPADTPADSARAADIYARYVHGGVPTPADYKLLQDFLFRAIALDAGHLGMAVHLHDLAGAGRYFSITGVNPLNLEPLFNDPRFAHTNFVLLHGGWPYVHEAGALLQKPNVYLDISQQAVMIPARTLSTWLREWLELYPDKVLFGTDGYPYSNTFGWEEATWLGARNARNALDMALTGMEQDGEISPARATELAHMVLHRNAEALYKLPDR
ncbi:MAG: amidohydrolase [Acidobacteriaceae bacterium]|jgi:predicted TIM-barrel fold metal-dependent hydrolase